MNDTPKSLEIDPPLPTSAQIRARLEAAKVRFHANDNIAAYLQPGDREALLEEVARYGDAVVRRIYGDFTAPTSAAWKKVLQRNAIKPVQQFAYSTGKNATDSTLIIDAMDLLYTDTFDGFCLVTSDSDFTGLATRSVPPA